MGVPLKILMVEDSESDAQLIIRELLRGGYDVECARVENAVDMHRALEVPSWDLVIADYSLPQFNAPQAIELLKETGLDIPLIVISGSIGEETAVATMRSGAHDYLLKSNLKRLTATVERELHDAAARREHRRAVRERERIDSDLKASRLRRLEELEALNAISSSLRLAKTLEEMLPLLLEATLRTFKTATGGIWLRQGNSSVVRRAVVRGWEGGPSATIQIGGGIEGEVFRTGQPFASRDFSEEPLIAESLLRYLEPASGGIVLPLKESSNVIGMFVVLVALPRELSPEEIGLLSTLSEIAGNAIHRTVLHQQTQRRMAHLAALNEIDHAITSSVDLRLSLSTVLGQVLEQLGVHAASILLFNPSSQMLEHFIGRGFRTRLFERARLRLGDGQPGTAVLESKIVRIEDLTAGAVEDSRAASFAEEEFVSYFAVPMSAKGQVRGVLEIFHRSSLDWDEEWLDFLKALAEQATIALDNATLFEGLQRSNRELLQAYDATIEGWSRALDLRDKETEGHTLRVTEMTVRLAQAFGLAGDDLVQIRWGALLHDIGKMGVPDGILLKPGPLTDDEWVLMRRHPVFAYEMLSPIRYLRLALDIPHYHHEKWDGTGYPRGLKGEQIPLPARIFSVVDVWDALSSDRPYRTAWPLSRVLSHIDGLAGTHFDPHVVRTCLETGYLADRVKEARLA